MRIQFRIGKPGCQWQGGALISDDATDIRLAPNIDWNDVNILLFPHWRNMLTQECVQKICYFQRARTPPENRHINLYIFVHFVHFVCIQRLRTPPENSCTLLYTFNVSFVSKELVPRLKTMLQISIFSVHSVHFDRSDLVNLKNLLVHMNPNPDAQHGKVGEVS